MIERILDRAEQSLNGALDERVIDACTQEGRALVSMDLDFANIRAYPPSHYSGIVVLRPQNQGHPFV